jgi:hypothetical protein
LSACIIKNSTYSVASNGGKESLDLIANLVLEALDSVDTFAVILLFDWDFDSAMQVHVP